MPSGLDDEAVRRTGPSELQAAEVFATAGQLSLSPASRALPTGRAGHHQ